MARKGISRELAVAVVVSIGIHAVWFTREAKASLRRGAQISEVSLETVAPPPKAAEPKAEPAPTPTPTNTPPEPVTKVTNQRAQPSATQVPPAAQAGRTLTADDDAGSDVADFTLVQGSGTNYVGGTTSAAGTSRIAVNGPASDRSRPAVKPAANFEIGSGPDRSRSATPENPAWDCSRLFPSDADAGDYATVLIAVSVGIDGRPTRVAMLRDPGHGFGAAATRCAMNQRYHTALNRQGEAVSATTPPILVRFSR